MALVRFCGRTDSHESHSVPGDDALRTRLNEVEWSDFMSGGQWCLGIKEVVKPVERGNYIYPTWHNMIYGNREPKNGDIVLCCEDGLLRILTDDLWVTPRHTKPTLRLRCKRLFKHLKDVTNGY